MKMTTRVAFDNMKYYKSRNILMGLAIILTNMLLLVVPTVGRSMLDLQHAAVNQLYPSWHAMYRGIDIQTARQLAVHHDISHYGLQSDAGMMNLDNASVAMMYMDQESLDLYKTELAEGTLPSRENEIAVSPGILRALGTEGGIGDTISIPYQIYRDGAYDYAETGEFLICGLIRESEAGQEQNAYIALISEEFLESVIPTRQLVYSFLFRINDADDPTTEEISYKIKNIAAQFGIPEETTVINKDYLGANYVDPMIIPAIAAIMMIIMLAGIITIYSIYYMSMNQRIQEFGRLKAIGATKFQVRQIVLREGLCVAAFAIPAGLLTGTLMSKTVLEMFATLSSGDDEYLMIAKEIVSKGEMTIFYWWICLLAVIVTLCTVYFSLARPMSIAAKISEIEAVRLQGVGKKRRSSRKGYSHLTVSRLTYRNLTDNRKKSLLTILSMSATGVLLMVVATVLSCADPAESADRSIVGQYQLSPIVEERNKEHPERKWTEILKDNPLDQTLKQQIEGLAGVVRVDAFTMVKVTGGPIQEGSYEGINGIPEEYAAELEKGITRGKVTYEELKSGDKVIADRMLLVWYPELEVGDKLILQVSNGELAYEKEFEIAAIGEYGSGMTNYNYFFMAKEAADKLCGNNGTRYFHVIADKDYDESLESALNEIVESSGRMEMQTWKEEYEQWKSGVNMMRAACYAFLGILAAISVMNLINTMINSIHVRKKEIGMMQAIGMSDSQLMRMLQLEATFYTLGTLLVSIGAGSLAGYPLFLYAKSKGMFEIATYHYPIEVALIIAAVLIAIQIALTAGIGRSVRKESLIDRIRFSE